MVCRGIPSRPCRLGFKCAIVGYVRTIVKERWAVQYEGLGMKFIKRQRVESVNKDPRSPLPGSLVNFVSRKS
jgi:hypothetical protein